MFSRFFRHTRFGQNSEDMLYISQIIKIISTFQLNVTVRVVYIYFYCTG